MMRRSELDARLAAKLTPLLSEAAGLVVGAELDGIRSITSLDELETGERFTVLLWLVAGETRGGLARLRGALAPGATLWLASPRSAAPWRRLRARVRGERLHHPTLEELCGGLVLAGFITPRVHAEVAPFRLVSACMPSARDPLDAFFEQPSSR